MTRQLDHLNLQNNDRHIYLSSHHNDTEALVKWQVGRRIGVIEIEQARFRGVNLLTAIAISSTEAIAAVELTKSSGYAKHSSRWNLELAAYLELIRGGRAASLGGIYPVFDLEKLTPAIQLDWYGENMPLTIEDATRHARNLMVVAEAATTDLYLLTAFKKCGIGIELQDRLFASFTKFRADKTRGN